MKKMGFIPRGADDRVFDRVIDHFHQRFQDEIQLESFSLREVKFDPEKMFQNLADLRRMDISLRELSSSFFIPKEWFLLERTVLLLLGLCTSLDPDLNPMSVIRPYLERFVLGPDQDWSRFVVTTTKELALSAVALPGEMRRFLVSAQRGQIEVSFRDVDEAAHLIYRLGHQVIVASLGVAAVVLAVIFEGRGQLARAEWCWYGGGVAAAWLALSWWSARGWLKKRRRR
jgi:ubiquinone biosynthesis protein